ncbi:MAG: MFS transporter, partial [Actinocatenispora sp.]
MMIALDATIMTIAVPSAQVGLGFSDADRQWIITAYTVAFGGLLLLGGRFADRAGRRRAFLIGLAGFATASALGGAAPNLTMLAAARAAQGAFAALLAPTVLSLLALTFTEARERAKAFGIFGAIAGGGGAAGLVLGGLLSEHLGWRWCLYVSVPIAIGTAIAGWSLLGTRTGTPPAAPEGSPGSRRRLDLVGALASTGGLVAVVYACARAVQHGWLAPDVLGLLVTGVVLLALFVLREARAAYPLLPLRILRDRNRVGGYLAVAFAVAGMLGTFLFLTYYLQVARGLSPVLTGLAFLPLSGAVFVSSQVASRLLPRVPPRALIAPGLLVAAGATALLTRLSVDSSYATGVLPAEILLGLGMGWVFAPAISTATHRLSARDAGVGAAVVNAAQQVGGSLGVALLNTVAATTTAAYLAARSHPGGAHAAALVHGYTAAATVASGLLVAAEDVVQRRLDDVVNGVRSERLAGQVDDL